MTWLSLLSEALVVSVVVVAFSRGRTQSDHAAEAFIQRLPFIALRDSYFPTLRTLLQLITGIGDAVSKGYSRYSKYGNLFSICTLGTGSVAIIPSSQLHILSKPPNQVAALETQLETWQPEYTIGTEEVYRSAIDCAFKVVRKHLTKDVGRFTGALAEELATGFGRYWNATDKWTGVTVYDSCSQITSRALSRLYFGLPLCRDEKLLEETRQYSTAVFGSAALITALPRPLRLLFGPLLAFPAKRRLAACQRILIPFIEKRLAQTRAKETLPDDILQHLIEESIGTDPERTDAAHVTQSLLILMMSSIHGVSYALTNCILDLYSSECSEDFVKEMREECKNVATKDGVASLPRIDSCLKESLRISGFTVVSLMRVISAKDGLQIDHNTVMPWGTRIGVPTQAIHHDPNLYNNPYQFSAFRFTGNHMQRQISEKVSDCTANTGQHESCTTINDRFLTFGYGRHACPGRFLATQMLTLAMAQVMQNYDIQSIKERPQSRPILNVLMPPELATISIRRRQG